MSKLTLTSLDEFPSQKPYVTQVLKKMSSILGTNIPAVYVVNQTLKERINGITYLVNNDERQPKLSIPEELLSSKSKLQAFTAHAYSNYMFETDKKLQDSETEYMKNKADNLNIFTSLNDKTAPVAALSGAAYLGVQALKLPGLLFPSVLRQLEHEGDIGRRAFLTTINTAGVALFSGLLGNTLLNNREKNRLEEKIATPSARDDTDITRAYDSFPRRSAALASGMPVEDFQNLFNSIKYEGSKKATDTKPSEPPEYQSGKYIAEEYNSTAKILASSAKQQTQISNHR